LVRILTGPARAGGRAYMKVVTAGVGMVTGMLAKVIGAQFLRDLSRFVASLETMFGGFRERADQTYRLLKEPGTAFVVVAVPERDALREAAYFVERLGAERMPLAGLVLNRVHTTAAPGLSVERALAAAEDLEERGGHGTAAAVLRVHAERMAAAAQDRRIAERFVAAHPGVPVVEVGAQASDVHDLDGLRRIGAELAGDRQERGRRGRRAG
jgi:anion-transporting  ArsA/GET3 family ATPase